MTQIDLDELHVRRDARRAEADRLEELAFESAVQASLTRPEHQIVPPLVEVQLRSLLWPRTAGATAAPR
jgi:hypothetical protein